MYICMYIFKYICIYFELICDTAVCALVFRISLGKYVEHTLSRNSAELLGSCFKGYLTELGCIYTKGST